LLVKNVFHDGAYQFSMALGALVVGDLLGASGMLALDPKRDHRFISSAFAICYSVIFILASINPFAFGLPVLLIFAGCNHDDHQYFSQWAVANSSTRAYS